MKKPIFTCLAVLVLLAGAASAALAAESAAESSTDAAAAAEAPKVPFTTPLKWKSSGVLVSPVSDATHTIVSVKDPTVVHLQRPVAHLRNRLLDVRQNLDHGVPELQGLVGGPQGQADLHRRQSGLEGVSLRPKPVLFHARTRNGTWSSSRSSRSIAPPTTSPSRRPGRQPQNFFDRQPAGMPRLPIDYHMICDDTHAYLFFTGDDGRFYRSRTKIEDFPNGMSDPRSPSRTIETTSSKAA